MSLINATTSAIAIAERRRGKLGAALYSGRPQSVLMRNFYALKSSTWLVVLSGFVEPVFYLLAFGVGLGRVIGNITDASGNPVSYAAYIAPALLATSAMNGAIYDSTWNVFFKMHFGKIYQAMLSTSLGPLDVAMGEIGWALLRGFVYACGFTIVVGSMGLIPSIWGLLAIPAAVLIAFGSGARMHARQHRCVAARPRPVLCRDDFARPDVYHQAASSAVFEVEPRRSAPRCDRSQRTRCSRWSVVRWSARPTSA